MTDNNLISFYDRYTPSIEAGMYQIKSTLDLQGYINDAINTREFEVRSPQFSLSLEEVHSAFPPNTSVGKYEEVLPSVVLNTKTLPWERLREDNVSWLFLLALNEDEIKVVNGKAVLKQSTVEDFFQDTSTLKPSINTQDIATDVKNSICNSITLNIETFTSLLPQKEEFKYLSHVRKVNIENQAHMKSDDAGWFSVVVGNRFLKSSKEYSKYFIHLISLEGVEEALANNTSQSHIRLISLFNYSCVSQKEVGKSFEELMKDMIYKSQGNTQNLLLKKYMPLSSDTATDKHVSDKINSGYTALNFNLLTKEETFSWYRGPFTPIKVEKIENKNGLYATSNAALIYDEEWGIFDNSYASAWTMGRLLALSNGSFSQTLFNIKRNLHIQIGRLMDYIKENPQRLENLDELQNVVLKSGAQKMLDCIKENIEFKTSPSYGKEEKSVLSEQEVLTKLLDNEKLFEYLQNSDFIKEQNEMIEWFAHKKLLYDVPLNHLLPNPDYLLAENIRFFYLDDNWTEALLDGAFSIGISISKDLALLKALKKHIKPQILQEAKQIRDKLLGKSINALRKSAVCGVLINSAVINGWPGLEIEGFIDDTKVNIVRMDHLDSGVLLCMFDEVPHTIRITEPQQSLCFGVTRDTKDGQAYEKIQLREPDGDNMGKPFPGKYYDLPSDCIKPNGVAQILKIQEGLAKNLKLQEPLTVSQFALQMIKAPQRITFEYQGVQS